MKDFADVFVAKTKRYNEFLENLTGCHGYSLVKPGLSQKCCASSSLFALDDDATHADFFGWATPTT